jgi:hypothetical protein
MKKLAIAAVCLLVGAVAVRADGTFTGTWDTTFGPVTMIQKGRQVTGSYDDGQARLQGTVKDGRLIFNYQEPGEGGEGDFKLSPDGRTITGKWRVVGTRKWSDWSGARR